MPKDNPIYDQLKALTLQERLAVAAAHYEEYRPEFAEGLRHAMKLVSEDGWYHLAPAWEREWHKDA